MLAVEMTGRWFNKQTTTTTTTIALDEYVGHIYMVLGAAMYITAFLPFYFNIHPNDVHTLEEGAAC